ncbi:heavy-metal-associated domain-containing protein [Niallia endozanthoxylica]|uniref:heavy-metal-associated domain-containing protein n=1 Tax=Niallia endozanthoxylica TaxID=2036016 RepID=UPI00168A7DC8|nr:cation transporter [Niallia endozanthoxylica]
MKERTLQISNLDSQEDAEKITQAVQDVWGITNAKASPAQKIVSFIFDERMASEQDFEQAIIESGFHIVSE